MPYYLVSALIASIYIPAAILLIRIRKIPAGYYPYVFYMWLGVINQTTGYIIINYRYMSNAIVSNIYMIGAVFLLLAQFYIWEIKSKVKKRLYVLCALLFIVLWTMENLVMHQLHTFNGVYRLSYSMVITVLSIDQFSKTPVIDPATRKPGAKFLICLSLLLVNSFSCCIEIFYVLPLDLSPQLFRNVFSIFVIVIFISHIINTIIALCIPKKQKFTFLFS